MKILMTGITGFIGQNLAKRFVNEGHEVFAIVRPTSKIESLSGNLCRNVKFCVYNEEKNILKIITDICAEGNRPDVVYHLASYYVHTHEFSDIENLTKNNITFGTELLDAMATNKIFNFVNTGTFFQHYNDEEYNPVDIHAATKKCFEDMIKFYTETRSLKCISLHLFDVYGLGDKRKKVFDLLKKIADSRETLKMSPGEQLIDLVHIYDIVDAFVTAGNYLAKKQYDYCGTYGVSSMNPIPLKEVVKIFEEISGKKLSIEWGGRPYREREIMIPWKSFKTLPGWSPKINLQEGLKKFLTEK